MDGATLRIKQFIVTNDLANLDAAIASLQPAIKPPADQADATGYTLLHWACHLLRPVIVKRLLELGASALKQDIYGKTALHKCLERSQRDPDDVIEAFAGHLTSEVLAIGDRAGRTAFHVACLRGFDKSASLLVQEGTDVRASDKRGWTGLHFASFYNRQSVVESIIPSMTTGGVANEAIVAIHPLSLVSKDGWTVTHAASSQGHQQLVQLFVEKGADPNARALNGQTPLHVACCNNHDATVKVLMEHDADPKIVDKSGLSCIACCASKEVRMIIKKTATKAITSAAQTSIVGMPHFPTAEREAKFAIQARDAARRRRTHGGDIFDVVIRRETRDSDGNESDDSYHIPEESPDHDRPNGTPHDDKKESDDSEPPARTPAVERVKTDSGSTLSGSTASLGEAAPGSLLLKASTMTPHDVADPRTILKSSQALSTPAVFHRPTGSQMAGSESSSHAPVAPVHEAPTSDDISDTIPRAKSDMAHIKLHSELYGGPSQSVVAGSSTQSSTFVVKDLDTGLYVLRWRPQLEGSYTISIKFEGEEISGSPFSIDVAPPRVPRVPIDPKRVNAASPPGSMARTSSGMSDDDASHRTTSAPVDLISNLKPDLTPKQPANQSAPALINKKIKKGKGGVSSIVITQPLHRDIPPAALVSSPSNNNVSSPQATPSSSNANGSTLSDSTRKRSASSAVRDKPTNDAVNSANVRDRSGTTVVVTEPSRGPISTVTIGSSKSPELGYPSTPAGNTMEPTKSAASSSTSRDRGLYRVDTTFSTLQPLPVESPAGTPPSTQASETISKLENTIAEQSRQLSSFSLRIQELETDQLVNSKHYEDTKAADRVKMVKLATALRAERDARLCKGCKKTSRNAVAIPCLHMSLCKDCIEDLETCPTCNGHLKGFITAVLEDQALEAVSPR